MLSLVGGFYQNYYRDEKEEIGAISVLDSLGLGLVSPIIVTSPLVIPRSKLLLNDANETKTTLQIVTYPETNEVYEGPVTADGKRHGQNATLINFSSYTPSDEMEPKGRYHSSSSMTDSRQKRKFIGSFYNDQFLEGTLITPEYTYIGNFRHCNKFHGFGSLISFHSHPDIEFEYTGEFQLGKYHGVGKLITRYDNSNVPDDIDLKTSRISSMYKGEFVNGKKSGFGTMYHFKSCLPGSPEASNGSKRHSQISHINPKDPNDVILHYSGEWKNDRKHGAGTLFSEHGTSVEYQGNFYKDRIVESTDENQNEAEGNTLNNEMPDEEKKNETLENEVITYENQNEAEGNTLNNEVPDEEKKIEALENEVITSDENQKEAEGNTLDNKVLDEEKKNETLENEVITSDENQNEVEGNTLNNEVLDEEKKIEALENGVSESETLENEVITSNENQKEAEGNTLDNEVLDEEKKIEALENGVSKSETLENEVITHESTSETQLTLSN